VAEVVMPEPPAPVEDRPVSEEVPEPLVPVLEDPEDPVAPVLEDPAPRLDEPCWLLLVSELVSLLLLCAYAGAAKSSAADSIPMIFFMRGSFRLASAESWMRP
jgi:hypothetical protein